MEPYRAPADVSPGSIRAPSSVQRYALASPFASMTLRALCGALVGVAIFALPTLAGVDRSNETLVMMLGLAGFALAFLLWTRLRFVKLIRANNAAAQSLNAGDARGAAEAFRGLVGSSRLVPGYRALFLANLGVASLRMCDYEAAIVHLTTALESGWFSRRSLAIHRPAFAASLALAEAARGDLVAARHWQQRGHAWLGAASTARLVLGDAALALRDGRCAEASKLIQDNWSASEGVSTATQMRALRLLRAFAIEAQEPGEGAVVSDPESVATLVAGAKPARAGEFGYLAAGWPAFQAFLARHGFEPA